jgi:hypothetical protein
MLLVFNTLIFKKVRRVIALSFWRAFPLFKSRPALLFCCFTVLCLHCLVRELESVSPALFIAHENVFDLCFIRKKASRLVVVAIRRL